MLPAAVAAAAEAADTVDVDQGAAAWNLVEVKHGGKIAAPYEAMDAVSAADVALDLRKDYESAAAAVGVHDAAREARGSEKRERNRHKADPKRLNQEKRYTRKFRDLSTNSKRKPIPQRQFIIDPLDITPRSPATQGHVRASKLVPAKRAETVRVPAAGSGLEHLEYPREETRLTQHLS